MTMMQIIVEMIASVRRNKAAPRAAAGCCEQREGCQNEAHPLLTFFWAFFT